MSVPVPSATRGSADAHLGRHARFGPIATLIIAALVRFHGLGSRSLWTDEGSTWTAATLPLSALLRRCVERDASPPLYYLLTSWAVHAFGDSEWSLRLVSALASLVLVWLTYRLARLGLPRNAATFAAMLCALSPFQVMYAQEARTYALVAALLVAGVYAHARMIANRAPRRMSLLLAGANALGLWTQSIATLGLAAQGALAVLTPAGRRRFLPWVLAVVAAMLLYAPWWWYGRHLSEHLSSSHWYIVDLETHSVFKALRGLMGLPMPLVHAPPEAHVRGLDAYMPRLLAWALVVVPSIVLLLLTLPQLAGKSPRTLLARVAWAGWGVPLAIVLVVSLRQPLLLSRYFVFVTPFLSVLYALGAASVRPRPLRLALCVLMLGFALFGLARYEHDYTKEPWQTVATQVRDAHAPGRTAVLVPFDVDPFAFYTHRMALHVQPIEVGHPDEPFAAHYTPRQLDELEARARADARPFDDVWVIVRSPNSDVRREAARRAELAAAEGRRLVTRERLESSMGGLTVTHWTREATATR